MCRGLQLFKFLCLSSSKYSRGHGCFTEGEGCPSLFRTKTKFYMIISRCLTHLAPRKQTPKFIENLQEVNPESFCSQKARVMSLANRRD